MEKIYDYTTAVDFLNSLIYKSNWRPKISNPLKKMKLSLVRMRALMKALGNPEKGINFVHIAGTSGKGSIATMVYNALLAKGLSAGLFTNPYLTTAIEEISVNGRLIDPVEFSRLMKKLEIGLAKVYSETPYGLPTYLEAFAALAFLAFREAGVSWAVIETGSGGRFDKTNIITPKVSVISNVARDHLELLGPKLENVAWHKAGIIKKKIPVVLGVSQTALKDIFFNEAKKNRSPLFLAETGKTDSFRRSNADIALQTIKVLGFKCAQTKQAITKTKIPARFELIGLNPEVILDSAHNPHKVSALVRAFKEKFGKRKAMLIFGVIESKDSFKMAKSLACITSEVFITQPMIEEVPITDLKKINSQWARVGVNKRKIFLNPFTAFDQARRRAKTRDCPVMVAGSLYLTGNIREIWWPEKRILKLRRNI